MLATKCKDAITNIRKKYRADSSNPEHVIHDGDCHIWGNQICTCGLLHDLIWLTGQQDYDNKDSINSIFPNCFAQLAQQHNAFIKLNTVHKDLISLQDFYIFIREWCTNINLQHSKMYHIRSCYSTRNDYKELYLHFVLNNEVVKESTELFYNELDVLRRNLDEKFSEISVEFVLIKWNEIRLLFSCEYIDHIFGEERFQNIQLTLRKILYENSLTIKVIPTEGPISGLSLVCQFEIMVSTFNKMPLMDDETSDILKIKDYDIINGLCVLFKKIKDGKCWYDKTVDGPRIVLSV